MVSDKSKNCADGEVALWLPTVLARAIEFQFSYPLKLDHLQRKFQLVLNKFVLDNALIFLTICKFKTQFHSLIDLFFNPA